MHNLDVMVHCSKLVSLTNTAGAVSPLFFPGAPTRINSFLIPFVFLVFPALRRCDFKKLRMWRTRWEKIRRTLGLSEPTPLPAKVDAELG